ncbi:UNVERIFIED_CONTAM: hypothetical protein GTU68_001539 [Idotea baltica]|nr:hypothetical protein [Idotea baltica]
MNQSSLFATSNNKPLAEVLRPQSFEEVVGQDHLLKEGAFATQLSSGKFINTIFWGPPGCGKTTIARLMASASDTEYVGLSSIDANTATLRTVFEKAKAVQKDGKKTLLFIDEIHRFNKVQQDLFLPYMENGTIVLVGATTENPSFALNNALLSRSQNLLSAFHKSLRSSDVNAALYWSARMLEGGEDPMVILRRMVAMASEDIGLADPQALTQALAAKEAYDFVGWPDSRQAIAQAVIYLATAPKSNAGYEAMNKALEMARKTSNIAPPMHALNAPTHLMKEQGYGKGYIYDHNTSEGISRLSYLPKELKDIVFYQPVERGFEREILKRLAYIQKQKK